MKSKVLKIASLLVAFSCVAVFLFSTLTNASGFSDLNPKHWCYEKVMKFLDKGYVCGYEDGTFRADQTITRAEYVKIVNNFFGYSENKDISKLGFSDVSEKDWFAGYVSEAVERGYITGYPDGTFRPQDPIRRQEATVILSRILEIDEEVYPEDHEDGLMQYSDGKEIEEWAYVAVHSYSVYNFINGYTDGTIKLLQNVTRAETIELLNLLEEKIVVEDIKKPNGGGSRVSRVEKPTVTAYELVDGKKVLVENWVNYETGNFEIGRGSLIEMTCATEGATIYYSIDGGTEQEYKGAFILKDGKQKIKAWAEKQSMADSSPYILTVDVDTVSPVVNGVKSEKVVKVTVKDYDFYHVGTTELSGVNNESLKYAWFTFDEDEENYVRETIWNSFENNSEIMAPEYPGVYYLGVLGSDIAENKIGVGNYQEASYVDNNVDFPNGEDDEETGEPFVIVTEIENDKPEDETQDSESEENSGDDNSSGDKEEDIVDGEIIEIVVNSGVTVIHDFDDLPTSGDVIIQDSAKPGIKYSAKPLNNEKYPFVKNYENNANKLKPITISRNSGDNIITINYERIEVSVKFDGNGSTSGSMPKDFKVFAGDSKQLPENKFEKIGHSFMGWSGDNGIRYEDEEVFEAKPDNKKVTLSAIWKPNKYKVIVESGDNYIESVSGSGIYEYDTEVNVLATIKEAPSGDSYDYVFNNWTVLDSETNEEYKIKDKNFNEEEKETSFSMPAMNLKLIANAMKIDVELDEIIIKSYTDSSKKDAPEAGDEVKYSVNVSNLEENPAKVKLNITALDNEDLISNIKVNGKKYDAEEGIEIGKTPLTITFEAEIPNGFPIYGDFEVEVEVVSFENEKLLDKERKTLSTEITSTINYSMPKDKNIVLLIDLSGSMGFCTTHDLLDSKNQIYKGDNRTYKEIVSGDYSGEYYNGKYSEYGEDEDFIFDLNGDIILNYDISTHEPWKNHISGDGITPCEDDYSRIEVLIKALTATNTGFIDMIAKASVENKEKISITLVTFSGVEDGIVDLAHSLARKYDPVYITNENGKIEKDAVGDLKKTIKSLEFKLHESTFMNTGFKMAIEAEKILPSGDNIEDYLIFFGDGKASPDDSEFGDRDTLVATLLGKFDYSYAIGFGSDFEGDENAKKLLASLLKNTGSETPYKANNAEDIINAFRDIALAISSTTQTKDGILTISGDSFDKAVKENEVFPIAFLEGETSGDRLLFMINPEILPDSEEWQNAKWEKSEDTTYNIPYRLIYGEEDKWIAVEIDLSGSAFANINNLKITLWYDDENNETGKE